MHYHNIKYIDPNKLLVIKINGQLTELLVPIRVIVVIQFNSTLPVNTLTYVEEIQPDSNHRIIYRIFHTWYPYWGFRIR
jgi:hypothetical protein